MINGVWERRQLLLGELMRFVLVGVANTLIGFLAMGVGQQLNDLFKENAGNTLGAEIGSRAALPPPSSAEPH